MTPRPHPLSGMVLIAMEKFTSSRSLVTSPVVVVWKSPLSPIRSDIPRPRELPARELLPVHPPHFAPASTDPVPLVPVSLVKPTPATFESLENVGPNRSGVVAVQFRHDDEVTLPPLTVQHTVASMVDDERILPELPTLRKIRPPTPIASSLMEIRWQISLSTLPKRKPIPFTLRVPLVQAKPLTLQSPTLGTPMSLLQPLPPENILLSHIQGLSFTGTPLAPLVALPPIMGKSSVPSIHGLGEESANAIVLLDVPVDRTPDSSRLQCDDVPVPPNEHMMLRGEMDELLEKCVFESAMAIEALATLFPLVTIPLGAQLVPIPKSGLQVKLARSTPLALMVKKGPSELPPEHGKIRLPVDEVASLFEVVELARLLELLPLPLPW